MDVVLRDMISGHGGDGLTVELDDPCVFFPTLIVIRLYDPKIKCTSVTFPWSKLNF